MVQPVSTAPATAGTFPQSVTVADLNMDGIPDLVTLDVSPGLGGIVSSLLGKGDGTFTTVSNRLTMVDPNHLVVGDWNNDGIPDGFVTDSGGANAAVLLGKGNGTLLEDTLVSQEGLSVHGLVAGDFNQDGYLDIAVTGTTQGTTSGVNPSSVLVFLGDGHGKFQAGSPMQVDPQGGGGVIVAADLNRDGIPDVVVNTSTGFTTLLSKGDGTFVVGSSISAPPSFAATIGDFNGDGILDLAAAQGNNPISVAVYFGNGDGTFSSTSEMLAALPYNDVPWSIASADFNGDGLADLATPTSDYLQPNFVEVLLAGTQSTGSAAVSFGQGPHVVSGAYSGDSHYSASKGSVEVDNQQPSTLALSVSPASGITASQPVTLVATLSPSTYPNGSADGDTVAFYTPGGRYNPPNLIGTGKIAGGKATLPLGFLAARSYEYTASYLGGPAFAPSTSDLLIFQVAVTQPQLTLTVSPPSGVQGQSGSVTATVTATNYSPTLNAEYVSFYLGKTVLDRSQFSAGTARLNIPNSTFSLGINTLTAVFDPSYRASNNDPNNLGATSNSANYLLSKPGQALPAVALAVTSAGAPVTSVASQTPIVLTATVAANGAPVSAGTVVFSDACISSHCNGSSVLGTAQLSDQGTASVTVRPGTGPHSLMARFTGTNSLSQAISTPSVLAVTGVPTTTAFASPPTSASTSIQSSVGVSTVSREGADPLTGTIEVDEVSSGDHPLFTSPIIMGTYYAGRFNMPSVSPATGSNPYAAVGADVNHDGFSDLIVANAADNNVGVLLSNGDGTFKTQSTYATGIYPYAVVAADFNRDGNPDLAVANLSDNTVSILLGKGDGTFAAQATYEVGNGPSAIAMGDLNGDGILDLAVTNQNDNTVSILLGRADGTFQAQSTIATGSAPDSIVAGDFNGDQFLDLAVACGTDAQVRIYTGHGDGTFAQSELYSVGSNPVSLVTGDLDGNGALDLAVLNSGDDTLTIFWGKGDGTFTSGSFGAGPKPTAMIAGDFSGTGIIDLVVADSANDHVALFRNDGTGRLTNGPLNPNWRGSGTMFLAAGDWNGDGLEDLSAVITPASSGLVLLNASGQNASTPVNLTLPGTHTLVAKYSGDTHYHASTSAPVQSTATKQTSNLILSANPNPSNYGQSTVFTATLNPGASSSGSDGEPVTFTFGNTALGQGTLSNGVATLAVSSLPVGIDTVKASYAGDNQFTATSTSVTQFVRPVPLTVAGPKITRTYGAANPTLAGTAQGAVNGDTFTVTGTSAATPASPPGTYPVTPAVTGNNLADYTVTSTNGTLTITQATPQVALVPSAANLPPSTPVTLTAKLTAVGSGAIPSGVVSFYDGKTLLGTGALNAGVATDTIASLAVGAHSITATYEGDRNYTRTTSSIIAVTISQSTVQVALTASTNNVYPSTAVTFTAQLTAAGTGTGPSGSVSFYDGTTLMGTAPLSSGTASYTTSSLAVGTHSITATYLGDSNYAAVSSNAVSEIVVSGFVLGPSNGGSSSATASAGGQAVYSLTISPPAGAGFPDAITFSVTGLPSGATATFSPSTLPATAGTTNVKLTVTVPVGSAATKVSRPGQTWPLLPELGWLMIPVLLLRNTRRFHRFGAIALFAAGTGLLVGLSGCGAASSSSTPPSQPHPQNYTLTVTAVAGSITQATKLTLTVN